MQNGVSKKSGKPYLLVTLEDLEGSVQVLCMNENYDKYRELLMPGKAILVIGEVNAGDDKPKIFPRRSCRWRTRRRVTPSRSTCACTRRI